MIKKRNYSMVRICVKMMYNITTTKEMRIIASDIMIEKKELEWKTLTMTRNLHLI